MMREIGNVRQIDGEPRRRWFSDTSLDLIVWLDASGVVMGFQLTYDKGRRERSLSWRRESGYSHTGIDDGEARSGRMKATPIAVADGTFDAAAIGALFLERAARVDPDLVIFVIERLDAYRQQAGLPPGGAS